MSEKVVSGSIKRNYPKGDFNPYKTMSWIYDNALHLGVGHTVLVVGYSKRFSENIIKGWHDAMRERGLLNKGDPLPVLQANEFVTHKGTIIRFEGMADNTHMQLKFDEACKTSTIIALCDPYNSPEFKNVIRETTNLKLVYDFSKNNEKVVDEE